MRPVQYVSELKQKLKITFILLGNAFIIYRFFVIYNLEKQ